MDDERVDKLTKELIKLGCNKKGCEGCYLLQFLVKTREHLYFPIEPKIETRRKQLHKDSSKCGLCSTSKRLYQCKRKSV